MEECKRKRLFVIFSCEHFPGGQLRELIKAMERRFDCEVVAAAIRGFNDVCKIFCIDDLPPATVEQIEEFVASHRIQEIS